MSGGNSDAFVTKLNTTGTALVYSTFLGGSGFDFAADIAIDSGGNAYVTGEAGAGFPVTPGAFQTSFNGAQGCVCNETQRDGHGARLLNLFGRKRK